MAVLGLILLVAAGVFTAAVVTSNTGAIETNLWGATISNVSLGVVFVAGMLATLVGVAGLLLLTGAVRRGRRLRQERKVLRRENQRLSQQVGTGPGPDGVPTGGIWRRRTEPVESPTAAPRTSTGPVATTDRGPTHRLDDRTVETAPPPAARTDHAVDDPDRPLDTRARATTDSSG